jgi:hypothetical protein
VYGISLVDGTPSGCSIGNCSLRKLTVEEADHWKYFGPRDVIVEDRWWERWPQRGSSPSGKRGHRATSETDVEPHS